MANVLHNKNTDEKRDTLPLNGGLEFSFPPAAGAPRSPWAPTAETSRQASVDYLSQELGDNSLATCLTRAAYVGGFNNKRSSSRREVEVNYAASNATSAGWRHLRSSTDPKGYTNPHQPRLNDSDHEMEQLLGLNSLHVPLEMRSISAEDQKSNTIRALADLFTCPLTSFPISVGLFCDEPIHGPNGTLTRLEGEIEALVQLQTQYKLNTNAALLYSPAIIILLLAYVLGIFLTWQVGVLIGVLGLVIQFIFLGFLFAGKLYFNWRLAFQISHAIAGCMRQLSLLTNFMFYHPKTQPETTSPVRIALVRHRLTDCPTSAYALLVLIKETWESLSNHYSTTMVRLQRYMRKSGYPIPQKLRLKRICCLPAYVVVIGLSVAILINLLLIRIYEFKIMSMLTDMRALPIFVIMSSIIFLSVCASVPSLFFAAVAVCCQPRSKLDKEIEAERRAATAGGGAATSPYEPPGVLSSRLIRNFGRMTARLSTAASPLVQLERSMESGGGGGAYSAGCNTGRQSNGKLPGLDNPADLLPPITATCEVDILAKTEFHKICELLHAFNFYLQHEQTRIVLCIDAFEYACPVKLAALFYQVHSLILSQPTAPVAFVIATNFKMFFEDRMQDCNPSSQASLGQSPDKVLHFIQNVADASHLILSNIHLPIFLEPFNMPSIQNLQQSQATLPTRITPVSQRRSADGRPAVGFELPLPKTPEHSDAGQVNGAFTSIEELASQPKTSDCGIGGENKHLCLTPSTPGRLSVSMVAQSPKPPASIVAVNASRIAQLRSNAHGIAEVFLATDEMAEQNAIILKNLVASTAFTSRLLRLNFAEFSVRQLVNWVFMTHHWPFHISWLIALVESSSSGRAGRSGELGTGGDEDEDDTGEQEDGREAQLSKYKSSCAVDRRKRSQVPEQSQCFLKLLTRTMEEIASMPPVATILTCDDRDPAKLLEFVQTKMACDYKRSELKRLIHLSLFLNPLIRICIRDLRQRCAASSAVDGSQKPQPDAATLDIKRPSETSQFAFQMPPYLHSTATETRARTVRDMEEAVQTTQDSSGETRSPLPVSIDSETTDRGICFSNPANTINYPSCPVHLKKALPPTLLSKMSVTDVCELLAAIADLPISNCIMYQSRLRQQNITGLVLSVCDLEKLRTEIQMNFGDWQLFRTLVLYLRQLEGANLLSSATNGIGRPTRHSETRSPGGNTSSQLETSLQLPDMTVVYPHAHMTGSNCQQPLTRQYAGQSPPQKNVFDVPVFVKHCTAASIAPNARPRSRLNAVSAQCTAERTISDFSFGSGTEEMEFIWRRDFKPETLKPQTQEMDVKKPVSLRTPLHGHLTPQPEADETADSSTVAVALKTPVGFKPKCDRASFYQLPHFFPPGVNCRLINTASFDSTKKGSTGGSRKGNLKQPLRTPSGGQAVPVWLDPSGKPIFGFSRSTIDLRSSDSCRHMHGASRRHKKSARKRMRREASSASLSAQQARLFKSASQGIDQMKMVPLQPAYIPNPGAGESQPSYIPVWYPNLSCMGERKPAETIIANEPPSSSASSVASENGTYDFPSEYSNHGQYYICPNHNTSPPPVQLEETGRIPDKRVLSTPGFDCTGGLPEYPRRPSKASSHHRHHHHQHPGLMQATCSYSPQEFFPKRSRGRQPLTPGPPSKKGDERSTASQRSGTGSRAHTPSVGHQAAQESYSPEECTCDYFLYMRGAEGEVGGERQSTIKNVNSAPTSWSYTHKISSPDLSEIEAMTSS